VPSCTVASGLYFGILGCVLKAPMTDQSFPAERTAPLIVAPSLKRANDATIWANHAYGK
jgi:hypothetical protein